ncbi:MBL fold metallo-hydrolase [Ruegeria marina]|uniref:Glyoxylase, beta-lactamase superfamily II n=1 Tax=Ruegeria marina TaxID=639004 RepID=A0A1G7CK39_9RHOB|nr:MBL fold metallo-hydrolase [Ruegeria marina]SDE39738.1 Glyoxylase, beta-lactamase superfamily II [Ruegeria marina]
MTLTRRILMSRLGAGLALTAVAPLRAWSAVETQLGTARITSLSDGYLTLPASFMFGSIPQDELAPLVAHYGLQGDTLKPDCNVTLLQVEGRNVLFDAGSGSAFQDSVGQLVDALDAVGLGPGDITDVIFTHAHPDHLWGVLDDFDDPLFASARHMIGRAERDYWLDPATVDTIGADRASFAVGAARRLEALEELETFEPGDEILPGVAAVATYGHTPGHMSFEIRSGSEALLVVGDAIGNHHLAFARPDWPSGSDQDQEAGAATRVALLDRLASEQMTMIGYHLPDGGMGRVERGEDGYRFVPLGG